MAQQEWHMIYAGCRNELVGDAWHSAGVVEGDGPRNQS